MKQETKRTTGEIVNTWAQTIAIFVAGVWAVYTFWHSQFAVPESAPVNVSVNLQLKKAGSVTGSDALVAVEVKFAATNPSSRIVYLLPCMWAAFGDKMQRLPEDEYVEQKLQDIASKALDSPKPKDVERYVASKEGRKVVALGRLFSDTALNPGETIQRTVVFNVPEGRFDVITIKAFVPNMTKSEGLHLRWTLNKDLIAESKLYRVDKNKKETPVDVTSPDVGALLEREFGYGVSESEAQLSLWETPR